MTGPATPNPSRAGALPRAAAAVDPNLMWVGPARDATGNADELRGFLRALETRGHAPALRPMSGRSHAAALSQADAEMLGRQEARQPEVPLVAIYQDLPDVSRGIVTNAVNVQRAMFETDSLPAAWLTPLLDRDEVWVPSRFNVETFARHGVPEEKLRVLGGTLDFELFSPGVEPLDLGAPDGHFTFLTTFDGSERNGWRQLIRAWAKAFAPTDPVCLVVKLGAGLSDHEQVEARIEAFIDAERLRTGGLAPIRVVADALTAAQTPRLYAAADAYVLASRGEGWGRSYMEALAMGLPTIGSRWSANLEFMDEETSWLVDGESVPVPHDAELFAPLYKGHNWFEVDADALADALLDVASNPEASRAKAAPARAELIHRFGPEATAARIQSLAAAAFERHGERRSRPVFAAVRGAFCSGDAMAAANEALAGELARRGHNAFLRAPEAAPMKVPATGFSQSLGPVFVPATGGRVVTALHWDYGAPPREWVAEARRKSDRVWVASEYIRSAFVEHGMPPGAVEVVRLGVDTEVFTPEGPRHALPRAGCTFLFAGNAGWEQGTDILIDAWRQAFSPGDDVQLVVTDERVKAIADATGETAPVVHVDIDPRPELYRACDVLAMPYRADGLCLAALEAMACGVPVIHNGQGPTAELVADGGWSLAADRVPLPPEVSVPDLAGPGYGHEIDARELAECLRGVAADATARRERGAVALDEAAASTWAAYGTRAADLLATLHAENLPPARSLRRAEIEARSLFAVYAPDWTDEAAWGPALDAWLDTFDADDDVTLALYVDGDADAVGARIMSRIADRDEATIADLALVVPSSVSTVALVASAEAVIADPSVDAATRPELLRRAARVVSPDRTAIERFAVEVHGRPAGTDFLILNTYPASPRLQGGMERIHALWSSMPEDIGATAVVFSLSAGAEAVEPLTRARPGEELHVPWSSTLLNHVRSMNEALGVSSDDVAAADGITCDDPYMDMLRQALARGPRAVVLPHPYLIRQLQMVDPDVPVVYEAQNVEAELKAAMYPHTAAGRSAAALVEQLERETCERAELIVCVSEEDRHGFNERYGVPLERMVVIENGTWTDRPQRSWAERRAETSTRCVFAGSGHQPNVAAAEVIAGAARLLPDIAFDLVGNVGTSMPADGLPANVRIHGRVSDEQKEKIFATATIALNPMLSGSGSNLKMVDYAAAGLPIVTTLVGARGFADDLTSCWQICQGTPSALAEAIAAALDHDWTTDIDTARRLVRERYDWRSLAARYADLLLTHFAQENQR